MSASYDLDLVVLTAGEDERQALKSMLGDRKESLGIRAVSHQILKHPRRDPGCLHEAEAILQPFHRRTHHALVMFDQEGCGMELASGEEIERDSRIEPGPTSSLRRIPAGTEIFS